MTYLHHDPREPENPHRLSLTVLDLKQIIETLERAQQAKIHFTGDLVAGRHRVSVHWESDQRDGDWLVITGIRQV